MEGSATVNIGRVVPSAEPEIGVASQGAAYQDKLGGNKAEQKIKNRSVDL